MLESSSFVFPYFLEKRLAIPTSPFFFNLLVNVFCVTSVLACNRCLRQRCLPSPPKVGCGHKIIILENISYRRTFLWENISYQSICLTGGHVLQEEMSYGRMCLVGLHVLGNDMF